MKKLSDLKVFNETKDEKLLENNVYKTFLNLFELKDNLATKVKTKYFISKDEALKLHESAFQYPNLKDLKDDEKKGYFYVLHFFSQEYVFYFMSLLLPSFYFLLLSFKFELVYNFVNSFDSVIINLIWILLTLLLFAHFLICFVMLVFESNQIGRNNLYVFNELFLMSKFINQSNHEILFKKAVDCGYISNVEIKVIFNNYDSNYDECFDEFLTVVYKNIYNNVFFKSNSLIDKFLKEKAVSFAKKQMC